MVTEACVPYSWQDNVKIPLELRRSNTRFQVGMGRNYVVHRQLVWVGNVIGSVSESFVVDIDRSVYGRISNDNVDRYTDQLTLIETLQALDIIKELNYDTTPIHLYKRKRVL